MITEIGLLRNIGQFDSISPGARTPLTKLTLFSAENGRGKTTFSAILRSLVHNNPTLIAERQRLGSQNSPHVVLQINGRSYNFQNNSWSAHFQDIAVFDDSFVVENVCVGLEISKSNKQKLHELILGARGIALNTQLQNHVARIEEHNRSLREKEAAIPALARGNYSIDAFCSLQQLQDVDSKILEAERNLAASTSAEAIRNRQAFQSFSLPIFDITQINDLLGRQLSNLQAETTLRVQNHFAKIGANAENWINEGMQKIRRIDQDSPQCPFCEQDLSNSEIIKYYEDYFSEAYKAHKDGVTVFGRDLASSHGEDIQSAFERSIRVSTESVAFWGQFMEINPLTIDTEEIARAWKAAREGVLQTLRSKFNSPLERMTLSDEIKNAIEIYDGLRNQVEILSSELMAYNDQIALLKERSVSANVQAIRVDLDNLRANKARFESTIADACTLYLAEKDAKRATEALRDAARVALDQYRTNIFPQYENSINTYLGRFNAGFRLSSVTSNNTRAGSSCTYNVLINSVEVSAASETGPSFRNTLSAGDRNTLALAFFFSSLDQDSDLAQKIVLIDDPMTSLDEHRTLSTIHEIRDLVSRVEQVIVFSHSKPFLTQLWEVSNHMQPAAYRINRSGQNASDIVGWDVSRDMLTQNDVRRELINNYISTADATKAREVASALRPVLEKYFRVAYSDVFPPGTLLGSFHGRCITALSSGSSILTQADITELGRLKDYANKFHHDTNPAHATELINDQELLNYCQRTIAFTRKN